MKNSVEEEYLRIIQDITDHQYDFDESQYYDISDDSWIPSESILAKKINKLRLNYHGVIDVTNFKKDKIEESILNFMNIRVGEFLIKIISYNKPETELSMNLSIWEKRYTTPNGNPCNMEFKFNILKDTRFTGRSWLQLFNNNGSGAKIPLATLIDIIRWMQAIKRMTAFL